MCDVQGECVKRLERLGVRVRAVKQLGEGALYFKKRALALVDADLDPDERDHALTWIADKLVSRRGAAEPRPLHPM